MHVLEEAVELRREDLRHLCENLIKGTCELPEGIVREHICKDASAWMSARYLFCKDGAHYLRANNKDAADLPGCVYATQYASSLQPTHECANMMALHPNKGFPLTGERILVFTRPSSDGAVSKIVWFARTARHEPLWREVCKALPRR